MLLLASGQYVWHVSKLGSDSNDGRANAYPVDLAARAKLTIGAAVSAASSGDTIIVWPGTYDESVDLDTPDKSLTLIGTNREACIINPTSTPATALKLENNCNIENLTLKAGTGAYAGIDARGKSRLRITNCHIESLATSGAADGLMLNNADDIIVRDCFIYCSWDALYVRNCKGVIVENCTIKTDGTNADGPSRAVYGIPGTAAHQQEQVILRNCIIEAAVSAANSNFAAGIACGKDFVIENCSIYVKTSGSATGNAYGIYGSYYSTQYSNPVVTGCAIYTSSASGSAYDIYTDNANNRVSLLNCNYNPAKVSGPGVVRDYLRPAVFGNALNVSATGEAAADAVKISGSTAAADNIEANIGNLDAAVTSRLAAADYEPPGEANPDVVLAAKMLINKAVQDKQTGEIKYYDDDGQTVVLTHTPQETEGRITRMSN